MFVFLGCNRMWSGASKYSAMVCMAIVSIVFAGLISSGCKKTAEPKLEPKLEPVFTNRMNDVAYLETLKESRTVQGEQARARQSVSRQMKACEARVKATLPAGADAAALKAKLAGDPEWQKLLEQAAQIDGRIEATLIEARETIRKRMEAEAQAAKAVAAGRAKALDQAGKPK